MTSVSPPTVKVSARADGSFTIVNSRTSFAKEYPRRR
jgi:hypothetical protein